MQKNESTDRIDWLQLLSALDSLEKLIPRHLAAIDDVVTPILNEGDLVSTCKKYVTLVRENHELPREYGTVRATLEGIQHGTAPQGTLHGKIGAVLSEMGKFQHAVFMLEYPSWDMARYVEAAARLWSLLAERDHLQTSAQISQLQTEVGQGFRGSFQWLVDEQDWLDARQRNQPSLPDFELSKPDQVVTLVGAWFEQWQRHVQKTLYGGRGLDYAIAQLRQEQPAEPIKAGNVQIVKILFLAANPSDATHLRVEQESREIDQALRRAEFRDRFDFKLHFAVHASDLEELLLRYKPEIVHFSGHGSDANEILFEDDTGASHPVSAHALSQLFSVLKDNIRCVVLNACYTEYQAKAIAEHIDCVVGMSKAIRDVAGITFATAFYQALGFGRDLRTAFDLGCVQIDLGNLGEQDTPKLLVAPGKDPRQIVLVQNRE